MTPSRNPTPTPFDTLALAPTASRRPLELHVLRIAETGQVIAWWEDDGGTVYRFVLVGLA
jgi:hypothetical protein